MEIVIYRYLLNNHFPIAIVTIIVFTLLGCGGKMLTYEQQLLGQADSLFHAGNYEYAKFRFDKIRTLSPGSPAARIAQYYLGYLNVYHENDLGRVDAALREFKQFVTLYPNDERIDEVYSWIKILTALQKNEKEYIGTTDSIASLKAQKTKSDKAVKSLVPVDSIAALNDVIRKCNHVRDSLSRKNKELENFIVDLEKKCTEAAGQ
jgi:outer membrane protein assembly factor BamD (BamD/ComL family)